MKDDEYDDKSNNKDVCRLKFEIRHQEVFFLSIIQNKKLKRKFINCVYKFVQNFICS